MQELTPPDTIAVKQQLLKQRCASDWPGAEQRSRGGRLFKLSCPHLLPTAVFAGRPSRQPS